MGRATGKISKNIDKITYT